MNNQESDNANNPYRISAAHLERYMNLVERQNEVLMRLIHMAGITYDNEREREMREQQRQRQAQERQQQRQQQQRQRERERVIRPPLITRRHRSPNRYLNNRSGVQFRMPNRQNPNINTIFNYDGFLPPIGRQPNNLGMNNNNIDWTRYRNSIENFISNLNMESVEDFQDVPIFPSNQQIENAVEIVRYGDMENNTTEQTVCPIDLTAFNEDDRVARIRHCGHCFKESNLRTWFASHSTCPICRYDIRDYVIMQDSNNTTGITNTTSNTSTTSNNCTTSTR